MPRLLLSAAALLLSAGSAHAAYQSRIIAPQDAQRDVALLRRALETVHPGLYRYATRAEIDAAFARLRHSVARPITDLAFHGEIALLLAQIHCDHTKAEMSDELTRYRETTATHLPLRFQIVEGRMIVTANDGQPGAPPTGSEILAVNGTPVAPMLLRLGGAVAYDGTTDQAIAAKLADDSDLMGDDFNEYWPAFFGFPDAWRITWKPIGERVARESSLRPIRFVAWTELRSPGARYRSEFYNAITWRMSGKAARLQVDTFVNYRNPVQATSFLSGFFKAMQQQGTEHLILDLRNNGGGSEEVSVALGRYLLPKPFLWSKPIRYKAVRYGDLPQYFETWGDREARFNPPLSAFVRTADGWYDRVPAMQGPQLSDADATFVQQPIAEGGFRGRLTILSGPRNGSGATRTIAQLKEKAAATVVGEDSAGSAEGPTSGSIFLLKLPASGLKVRIPEAWNRTNIASWVPDKGVSVDRLVVPTVADLVTGRDRTLEVARAASPAAAPPPKVLGSLLAGRWTGTLDYRDFGTDRRVVLPTQAEIAMEPNGAAFRFGYDDGPGKRVTGTQRWLVTGDELRVESDGPTERYRISELRSSGADEMTLVFDGTGRENGVPVSARTIVARRGDTLSITRMTRASGAPFLMRHAYLLTVQK